MRVVYLDVLILLNAYMTLFQLAAAARLCRVRLRGLRLALGSLAGGVAALLFFADLPAAATAALNLAAAALIALIGLGYASARGFLLRLAAFVGAGAVMAGAALALQLILRPADDFYGGGVYYFDLPPLLLIAATAVCYGLLRIFGAIAAGRAAKAPRRVEIELFGRRAKLTAIIDSGNLLADPAGGCRVMVAQLSAVLPLFSAEEAEFFTGLDADRIAGPLAGRLRVIPCRAVGASGLLPAFRPDAVLIEGRPSAEALTVAVTDKISDEYDGLLPAAAVGEGNDK